MNRRNFLNNLIKRKSILTEKSVEDAGYKLHPIRRGGSEISKIFKFTQEHGAYICGGYALYAWNPTFKRDTDSMPGDVDIYSLQDTEFYDMKADFEDRFRGVFTSKSESKHSYTYTNCCSEWTGQYATDIKEVQLIKPVQTAIKHTTGPDVFDVLNHFDFYICQAAIISESQVVVSKQGEIDIHSKRIGLTSMKNPYITLARIAKYIAKGYKIDTDTMDELFKAYVDREKREKETGLTLIQEFNISGVNS